MAKKQVDRRQFVKKAVAGAAVIATSAAAVNGAHTCPVSIGDWWCVVDYVEINPVVTLYTWEHCPTGNTIEQPGDPGLPTGACANAANEMGCLNGLEISRWEPLEVGGKTYMLRPEATDDFRRVAVAALPS